MSREGGTLAFSVPKLPGFLSFRKEPLPCTPHPPPPSLTPLPPPPAPFPDREQESKEHYMEQIVPPGGG